MLIDGQPANRIQVIMDSDRIYIELDEDKQEMLLAYDRATDDREIADAWQTVTEFGYHWVQREYYDADWQRYVCKITQHKDGHERPRQL